MEEFNPKAIHVLVCQSLPLKLHQLSQAENHHHQHKAQICRMISCLDQVNWTPSRWMRSKGCWEPMEWEHHISQGPHLELDPLPSVEPHRWLPVRAKRRRSIYRDRTEMGRSTTVWTMVHMQADINRCILCLTVSTSYCWLLFLFNEYVLIFFQTRPFCLVNFVEKHFLLICLFYIRYVGTSRSKSITILLSFFVDKII